MKTDEKNDPLRVSAPDTLPGRPRYALWDRQLRRWWDTMDLHLRGEVQDLSLTPDGCLMLRTASNPAIHESAFAERFVVVPHLDNFKPGLN